jgi:glutaconate CoA-transferase, subunit B
MCADYTPTEMMIVAAARQLEGEHVCFVGTGPPNIACNLAKRTVAAGLELVYESGVYDAVPSRLPLSVGDPVLATGSMATMGMFDLFAYYLQGGLIDVGFLGAAQIDRFGNINTTVIGSYDSPAVRLPGSGGACDISTNARKVFVIMPQSKRTFVESVDFITSPGHTMVRPSRDVPGSGPSVVVTGLGLYRFDENGEMYLCAAHPGVSIAEIKDHTGWDIKISADVGTTSPPTCEELRLIREDLDPSGVYRR